MKTNWIWLYTAAVAAWAYWCTRGADGQPMAAIAGFGVLGVLYWWIIRHRRPITIATSLVHMAIFEIGVIAALAADPQLDEMAGILNLWIPAMTAAIVIGGAIVTRVW